MPTIVTLRCDLQAAIRPGGLSSAHRGRDLRPTRRTGARACLSVRHCRPPTGS